MGASVSITTRRSRCDTAASFGPRCLEEPTLSMSTGAALTGAVSDDGLPQGGRLTITWSKVSGPGTVTFGDASALTTTAAFGAPGAYVLRLTVSDGALQGTDDLAVSVVAITFPTGPFIPGQ